MSGNTYQCRSVSKSKGKSRCICGRVWRFGHVSRATEYMERNATGAICELAQSLLMERPCLLSLSLEDEDTNRSIFLNP
jgi:hypothetical protein